MLGLVAPATEGDVSKQSSDVNPFGGGLLATSLPAHGSILPRSSTFSTGSLRISSLSKLRKYMIGLASSGDFFWDQAKTDFGSE